MNYILYFLTTTKSLLMYAWFTVLFSPDSELIGEGMLRSYEVGRLVGCLDCDRRNTLHSGYKWENVVYFLVTVKLMGKSEVF